MGRPLAAIGWANKWLRLNRKIKGMSKAKNQQEKPMQGRFTRLRDLFDPSRHGSVLFVLFAVGIYIAVRVTVPSGAGHAQLRFVESSRTKTSYGDAGIQASYREPLSGSEYERASRFRELGALGMAISLSVFARQAATGNAPATHHEVIREMIARKLMPPGIEVENGSFRSGISDLRFNYRREPLSFEILAQAKGSALLIRFPLPASETNSVMYFEASNSSHLPAPFSSIEQITGAGWRIRHWRGDALPLNQSLVRELREQDEWLKSQNSSR